MFVRKKTEGLCRMWTVGLCVVALIVIYYTHWFIKWRNPKSNGVLPPGTMGLPLIGETIQLTRTSYGLDMHPFIKNKIKQYGPIFKTSLAGRPVVVSADQEFNQYIVQQEGRAVEMWYLDMLSKFFGLDTEWLKALGIWAFGSAFLLSPLAGHDKNNTALRGLDKVSYIHE